MAFYSQAQYWDQRYLKTANDPPCEWYRGYHGLRHLLNSNKFATKQGGVIKQQQNHQQQLSSSSSSSAAASNSSSLSSYFPPRNCCRVLILGCGNSTFGEDMLRDGWTGGIVNVDFSETVVSQMKQKYGSQQFQDSLQQPVVATQKLEFVCADVTRTLPFDDGSFDLIICKAAFDAVLCGSKANRVRSLVAEASRVLAAGHGVFFLVTNGNPDSRLEYLEHKYSLNYYWTGVAVHKIPCPGNSSANTAAPGSAVTVASSVASTTASISSSTTTKQAGAGPKQPPSLSSYKEVFAYICRKRETAPRGDANKENTGQKTSNDVSGRGETTTPPRG